MSYPNPYNTYDTSGPYLGGADPLDAYPCPVCGAPRGQCVDGAGAPVPIAPMPYPPVDVEDPVPDPDKPPLRPYRVTVFGYTSVMQLNDDDAARYGDAAIPA